MWVRYPAAEPTGNVCYLSSNSPCPPYAWAADRVAGGPPPPRARCRPHRSLEAPPPHLLLRAAEMAQDARVVLQRLVEAVVVRAHHVIHQRLHPLLLRAQLRSWGQRCAVSCERCSAVQDGRVQRGRKPGRRRRTSSSRTSGSIWLRMSITCGSESKLVELSSLDTRLSSLSTSCQLMPPLSMVTARQARLPAAVSSPPSLPLRAPSARGATPSSGSAELHVAVVPV